MEHEINTAEPKIMHIDLNSCFATIEQQANRRQRGRPVGVAAYDHPNGIILAASYEAKALGVKLGTRVKEAKALCPGIYIVEPDPPKYREAHRRFREVLEQFTSDVTPKSIDEFVLDLTGSPSLARDRNMEQIGFDIKQRVYEHVGEAVRCNVGIGPNRFLAKLAAGLHKPDGLDRIDAGNLAATYKNLHLTDLPGINRRFNVRLRLADIHSPLEFLHAPRQLLTGPVFHGIFGYYWWLRLRGWEIDAQPTKRSQIGHQYAIPRYDRTPERLHAILAKLCEKTGRRLREKHLTARSLHVGVLITDYRYWSRSCTAPAPLYATQDIYRLARHILSLAPDGEVKRIDVGTHQFAPADPAQLSFFDGARRLQHSRDLAHTMDVVNSRYGEFVMHPASMMGVETAAKDAIAFGKLEHI